MEVTHRLQPAPAAVAAAPESSRRRRGEPPDEGDAFAGVRAGAAGHFVLNFYAAVDCLLRYTRRLAPGGAGGGPDAGPDGAPDVLRGRYPFLAGYDAEICGCQPPGVADHEALAWWEQRIDDWESRFEGRPASELPLAALRAECGLLFPVRVALMLAGLVEEDSRFGTVLADLQAPLPHRRPTVEFVRQVLAAGAPGGGTAGGSGGAPADVCRPLLAAGLLDVTNPDAPQSEWVVRVPPVIWGALRGELEEGDAAGLERATGLRLHPPEAFAPIDAMIAPPAFLDRLRRVPGLLASGEARAVVVRGVQGTERLQALGAAARALGRGVIEVPPGAGGRDAAGAAHVADGGAAGTAGVAPEPARAAATPHRLLGPLCCLTRSVPVLTYDLAPGETADIPALAGYGGPIGVVLGPEGGVGGRAAERSITLVVPVPDAAGRLRHWRAALGARPAIGLEEIADRFHLPGGYIRELAGVAAAHATLARRQEVTIEDVRDACRSLNRQRLDPLATRLDVDLDAGAPGGGGGAPRRWEHLILGGAAAEKLAELTRRCRHRERLSACLGPAFAGSCGRGVRALFSGPSGTGKTLAARVLAFELGMDLYRVDLSAVVNKYIGETEKNLHRVLAAAESLDVICLIDEGDSLMGSRTQVKSSNDRYANLETNFLLQRLESYAGILLVTTNAGDNIDRAFQRRMDVVVDFLPPGAEERLRIWQTHLPPGHAVDAPFLEDVCVRCALTGGQIRNAAVHAALAALDEGAPAVAGRHVAAAVASEYRKAGAVCPVGAEEPEPGPAAGSAPGPERSAAREHTPSPAAARLQGFIDAMIA